jgi:serine/threonine protein kinase
MRYIDALQAGTQVDQYVIEEVLGQGGFGIVYRARHPVHGLVALKEFFPKSQASRVSDGSIAPSTPRSEEAFVKGVEKLLAEGDKLKGLKHDNIVKVIQVFEHNHTAYLVMEDVDGPTLQAVIDEKKLVADKAMVEDFAKQMIDALALVHSAGLIHRDIAPDNILVEMNGGAPRFVLIDFGGAKRVVTDVSESSSRSLTKTGFSSPEQYGSESAGGIKATPASDVYSLAATLYWLISGRKPIDAPNRHVQDTLVPLADDDALKAIYGYNFLSGVDHGLSMRPDARPESVPAFQRSLEQGYAKKQVANSSRPKQLATVLILLVIGAAGLGGFGYAQGWFNSEGAKSDPVASQTPAPSTPATSIVADPIAAGRVAVRTEVVKEVVEVPSQERFEQPVSQPSYGPPAIQCRTINEPQQQCKAVYRSERQCSEQSKSRRVDSSRNEIVYGQFPSQSVAENVARSQYRGALRDDLESMCDGSLSGFRVSSSCDYDSSSPTGASCDIEAQAQCNFTKEVCRNVSIPQEECSVVNVPREVCQ